MLERVENQLVRSQVRAALRDMIRELLRLASHEKETAPQQWAGELLANIYKSIGKYDKKLSKTNAAYRDEKSKLAGKSLTSALFPKYVGEIVESELRRAEGYRFTIPILVEGLKREPRPWVVSVDENAVFERVRDQLVMQHLVGGSGALWTDKGLAAIEKAARAAKPTVFYPDEIVRKRRSTWKDMVPEEYQPAVNLPPFPTESEPKWWDFLWPLIRKRINLVDLDLQYELARKRYLSDSQTTARDHLTLLARLRDAAILQ